MLAARSGNAREKCPSGAIRWPRGRRAPAPRAAPRALGAGADAAKNRFPAHFFLAMPKTWPYIQKIGSKISREREKSGKEGENASTGTTPAARAVRLRRRSAQQPWNREDVDGRGGQARAS